MHYGFLAVFFLCFLKDLLVYMKFFSRKDRPRDDQPYENNCQKQYTGDFFEFTVDSRGAKIRDPYKKTTRAAY
jgi:hypothetical protein